MGLFKKIFGGGSSDARRDAPNALWLYVRCDRCGTPLAVRINRENEITTDYESGERMLRKEMMDGKCFQLMYAELHFDAQGNVTEQHIERGRFLTRAEYEAAKAQGSR